MIFIHESTTDSRPPGCPPCNHNCAQGLTCPNRFNGDARHPPPDRSTAGGFEPFCDEDADGLGVFRGLLSAIVLTAVVAVILIFGAPLLRILGFLD